MDPVIDLDISKDKSDGQVFFDKVQPLDIISNVRIKTEKAFTVILESTGHYHHAVILRR